MDLRRPDVVRFLTRDEKLPTSVRGQLEGVMWVVNCEWHKKIVVPYYSIDRPHPDVSDLLLDRYSIQVLGVNSSLSEVTEFNQFNQ